MRSSATMVALLFSVGCGRTDCESGPDAMPPDEVVIVSGTRIVVGCRSSALVLGTDVDAETAQVSVAWIDERFAGDAGTFAVGWLADESYQVRLTTGFGISNTLVIPGMGADTTPQLFWNGSDLQLYYALADAVFVDTVSVTPSFEVVETGLVGTARGFRAVSTEPGRVAVLGGSALLMDGAEMQASVASVGAVGWNGDYFLFSGPLGHGEWTLSAIEADGSPKLDALELTWSGVDGTGRGAGSAFASSPATERHAVAIAARGQLSFAVEGMPLFEAGLLEPEADISTFWDGERYVVLVASGDAGGEGANRDIGLLSFDENGSLLAESHELVQISQSAGDERFPVGASATSGDYGIVWIREQELVMQRCRLTER